MITYFIEVEMFKCLDCGVTAYSRKGMHDVGLVNTRGTLSQLRRGCDAAKRRGGKARIVKILVEEIYAGQSFHGKLSNYKVLRTETRGED